jgi:hypothetical protein
MRLYEITNDYLALMEAVENGEIPEEALADTLEAITASIEDKADNMACLLKNLDAEIVAIKAEEDRLKERRKAKENTHERIKQYLSDSLQRAGLSKVETARNKITFRKSEKVVIEDELIFAAWAMKNREDLLTYSVPKANLTAIKAALKSGAEVEGAELRVNQNIQIK